MNRDQLHSHRYVTAGYKNALHRAYLYGLGLSDRDLARPFVGVAQCFHDARPEFRSLTTTFEITKDAIARADMTSRHFLVPVAARETDAADSIRAREMAADSAELVVRGHWYDVLVGVASTPSSMFGVAQAICRLHIPGVVLVPAAVANGDESVAAALDVLQALRLASPVDADVDALAALMGGLREEIATPRVATLATDLKAGALGGRDLPDWLWPDVAAIAYEAGISVLADLRVPVPLGLGTDTAPLAGIEHPGRIDSPLNYNAL